MRPTVGQQTVSQQALAAQEQAAQVETGQEFVPAIDLFDRSKEVVIFADLPGVDSDSIDIQASNCTISLTAERLDDQELTEDGEPLIAERGKVMHRRIQLPAQCDVDKATASWNNGVVTIRLPKIKSEESKKTGFE